MKTLFLALIMFTGLSLFGQNYCLVPDYPGTTSPDTDPFDITYGYTRTAIIYNKSNIGASGTINQMVIPVITGYNDSINITIKLKEVSFSTWGGTGTYSTLSSGATTVFSGKVKFNAGYCYINLTTPFAFSNTNHLIIFTETDFGGSGSSTQPTFACYTIDNTSGYEYYSLTWHNDFSAPTSNGLDGNKYPVWALVFDAPDSPQSFHANSQCDGMMLNWQKNTIGDDVIIVRKAGTAPSNKPIMGTNYSIGDDLGNFTYIAYVGSAQSYLDTAVIPGTNYYYVAYSDNGNQIFSANTKTDDAYTPYNTPYFTDFDAGSTLPSYWNGDMTNEGGHGTTDNGIAARLNSPADEFFASTASFCGINSSSIVEFNYRFVNYSGYPNTATPTNEIGTVYIQVSNNNGSSFTTIDSISSSNHTASTSFHAFQSSLAAYSGEKIIIKLLCTGGSGDYYFDFDDFQVHDYVGINESNSISLLVYPNPTSDMITIDNSNQQFTGFQIFDFTGKLLMTITSNNETTQQIDISNLNAGIYIIVAFNGTSALRTKLIKK